MVARRYDELECWQLANELKLKVYALTARSNVRKDLEFCQQIRGSGRSATSNMAEGFGRFQPGDFARFLDIARASLLETHNHLNDAVDLGYLSSSECRELCLLADRATGATTNLARYLRQCKRRPKRQEPRT
jgi:four helix bundle protein